jgi:hypothetical protein
MSELGEKIAEVVEEAGDSRLGTIVALLVAWPRRSWRSRGSKIGT